MRLTKVRATVFGTVHFVTTEANCADPSDAKARATYKDSFPKIIMVI